MLSPQWFVKASYKYLKWSTLIGIFVGNLDLVIVYTILTSEYIGYCWRILNFLPVSLSWMRIKFPQHQRNWKKIEKRTAGNCTSHYKVCIYNEITKEEKSFWTQRCTNFRKRTRWWVYTYCIAPNQLEIYILCKVCLVLKMGKIFS